MNLQSQSFGKTDLQIPPLVFGTTSLGNLFKRISDEEKARIVAAWFECGFEPVVIDSAGKYGAGMALEVIGRELQHLGIPADQAIISNKLGWRRVPLVGSAPSFEPEAWIGLEHDAVLDISYDGILRCWEEGNQLLGNRQAALVSVHDPDEYLNAARDADERQARTQHVVSAYRALTELRDSGQVTAVGIGAKDWRSIKELSHHCNFDWIMFANSFTVMRHPRELNEFLHQMRQKQVGIINSALFHGGFLLGGDFLDYRLVDASAADQQAALHWRSRFLELCDQHHCDPFHVGVSFGRAHPAVASVALSSSRAGRIPSHREAVATQIPARFWQSMRDSGLLEEHVDFL